MTKGCGTPVEGDKICKVNLRVSASASAAAGFGDVEAILICLVRGSLFRASRDAYSSVYRDQVRYSDWDSG